MSKHSERNEKSHLSSSKENSTNEPRDQSVLPETKSGEEEVVEKDATPPEPFVTGSREGAQEPEDATPTATSSSSRRSRALSTASEELTGFPRKVVELYDKTKTWFPITFMIAAAPGLTLFPLLHRDHLDYFVENQLEQFLRYQAAAYVVVSLVIVGILYASQAIPLMKKEGWAAAERKIKDLNDRLFGLLLLPFVPPLLLEDIETTAPYLTVFLAAGAAAVTCIAIIRYPKTNQTPTKKKSILPSWAPLAFVLLVVIAYAIVAAIFSINIHHNFYTADFDLGIYDQILYNSLRGRFLACSFVRGGTHISAHVDPILILLSPIYLVWPGADTLLILQAFWLPATAIPIYLMGKLKLGRPWLAAIIACCVVLHPGMHGSQFYMFHSLALIAPFLALAIYALEIRNKRLYWVCIVILLLCREDISLLCCCLALYPIITRRDVRLGLLTIAVSLVYFVFLKVFIMPDPGLMMSSASNAHSYSGYYSDLIPVSGEGASGLLLSLLTNPFFVLRHVFSPVKLMFLAVMFVPVLFLPFFAHRGKVMMLYGLTFMLLASKPAVFSVHFQYPSILYPIMFMLVPLALSTLNSNPIVQRLKLDPNRVLEGLTMAMLVASIVITAKFGGLIPNDSFLAGFRPPQNRMTDESRATYEWFVETAAMIPEDAAVSASRFLVPHLTNRKTVQRFPRNWGAEYVFVNKRKAKQWGRINYRQLRESKAYEVIRERGDLVLMKRRRGVDLPERLKAPPERRQRW